MRLDALPLDVFGVELENVGFLGVEPDDGVRMRH